MLWRRKNVFFFIWAGATAGPSNRFRPAPQHCVPLLYSVYLSPWMDWRSTPLKLSSTVRALARTFLITNTITCTQGLQVFWIRILCEFLAPPPLPPSGSTTLYQWALNKKSLKTPFCLAIKPCWEVLHVSLTIYFASVWAEFYVQ